MGTLLHSCGKVCKLIELSFGVVSLVGQGTGVLDGSRRTLTLLVGQQEEHLACKKMSDRMLGQGADLYMAVT